LKDTIEISLLLKTGDNITTDHIMPAGSKILPLRSNIPAISQHVFEVVDATFPKRAKEKGGGFVLGGENYGQGSSREHAALAPMYLGVKAVIAKSFARIHWANLVNFGILPLTFANPVDYDKVDQGDILRMENVIKTIQDGKNLKVKNVTKNTTFECNYTYTPRQKEILIAGGLLNHTKKHSG
jgi:aconitate hydratase